MTPDDVSFWREFGFWFSMAALVALAICVLAVVIGLIVRWQHGRMLAKLAATALGRYHQERQCGQCGYVRQVNGSEICPRCYEEGARVARWGRAGR